MIAASVRTRLAAAAFWFASGGVAWAAGQPAVTPAVDDVHGPYLIVDATSGRVIEEFDALRPWYPASTSKLMTLYTTFRAVAAGEITLGTEIVYSPSAAAEPASKMGFPPGTVMTLDHALKMMMVKSANDIAVAVAEAVGGSVAGFADRMNAESERLGMTRSHWVNPNGLPDPRQVTSARDMALLGRALLSEFAEYREYYKLPAIRIGGKVLKNFNALLDHYPGATGMKTGFICASGYNLVASANRSGRELIVVVFGEYGGKARTRRAAELLDAGFASGVTATEPTVLLPDVASGAAYKQPLDMRPYVCGPKRKVVASEANDEDSGAGGISAHLTTLPIYIGPPVLVTARAPVVPEEPKDVARIPRPRPNREGLPETMNAFAPVKEDAIESAPAEAIGAAAGDASPLNSVKPE